MSTQWEDVKGATNRLLKKYKSNFSRFDDPVKEIYNNQLPEAMKDAAAIIYFAAAWDQSADQNILRMGQKQLEEKGFIK